jgi:hypothetical protein
MFDCQGLCGKWGDGQWMEIVLNDASGFWEE